MAWPLSQDYNEAIQTPQSNFADPDLKRGEAVCNALGIPMPYSGNFADVYQVRCPDGKSWAVKCFTRQAIGLRERYAEISKHLQQAKLPFTVDFTYLEQGIRVAGTWYPVLKMQWVEGLTLNQFVGQYLQKPAMLETLFKIWGRMAKCLRDAEVAHCDLQHGNVLLAPAASANTLALKLIDYDGMWVPALAGRKSGEVGHASYQHPQRLREETYSLEVDRFPVLLIATALRALKVNENGLWEKYDNGDNLLFKETDLLAPTKSPLFLNLIRSSDARTAALADHLLNALRGGLESTPLLDEALSDRLKPAATPSRPVPVVSPPATNDPTLAVHAAPVAAPMAPIAPAAAAAVPPTANELFDFSEPASAPGTSMSQPKRARAKQRVGVPVWAWAGAIALLVAGLAAMATAYFAVYSGSVSEARPVVPTTPPDSKPKPEFGSPPNKDKNAPADNPPEPNLPDLIQALNSDDATAKTAGDAIRAANLDSKQVEQLGDALRKGNAKVRLRVMTLLQPLGPAAAPAVPGIIDMLAGDPGEARQKAIALLAEMGPAARNAGGTLDKLLDDDNFAVRLDAAMALAAIKGSDGEEAVPVLIEALRIVQLDDKEQAAQRDRAVEALGRVGDPAVDPLLDALEDGFRGGPLASAKGRINARARVAAVQALVAMGKAANTPKVKQSLAELQRTDPSDDVRNAASEALMQILTSGG